MPGSQVSTGATPSVNPDLKVVHSELVALAIDLDAAIANARTSSEVNVILDELSEVNARVSMVGRQLFTQQTAKIKTRAEAVLDGIASTKAAIKQLNDIKSFIQTVTGFLGLVDKLLATAKLVI